MNRHDSFQGREREFVNLLQTGNAAENSVLVAYNNWLPNRKEAIRRLKSLADKLDEFHDTSNKFSLVGSGASAVGGGLFIAGLVLAPFTAGASALTTAGAVASTVGSATSIISSLAEMGITKSSCASVQMIVDNDKKYTNELIAKLEKFDSIRDQLISLIENTPFSDEDLMKLATKTTILCKKTAIGKIVLSIILPLIGNISTVSVQIGKLLSTMGIENAGQFLQNLIPTGMGDTVRDIGKQVFRAPGKLAKVVRIGLGITAGVFVVLDIWTMVSVVKDMEKGSKSETGEKFREVAADMESGKNAVDGIIREWRSDYPGLSAWGN